MLHPPRTFRIGFRWDSAQFNACLLQAGGILNRSHVHDLADGCPAVLNAAVMQQARDWYRAGGRRDPCGPGIYFSVDLFRPSFAGPRGPDLLVFDFNAEHGGEWDNDTFQVGNWKAQADTALDTGRYDSLPLIAYDSWRGGFSCYVILRTQWEGKNTGVKVRFHPPTAEDVIQIWRQYTFGQSAYAICSFLAEVASGIQTPPWQTRPAEILFHRLLCDHGAQALLSFQASDWHSLISSDKDQAARLMRVILDGFNRLMPNDPRTASIGELWARGYRDSRQTTRENRRLDAITKGQDTTFSPPREWKTCKSPYAMARTLDQMHALDWRIYERKVRLFTSACCRRLMPWLPDHWQPALDLCERLADTPDDSREVEQTLSVVSLHEDAGLGCAHLFEAHRLLHMVLNPGALADRKAADIVKTTTRAVDFGLPLLHLSFSSEDGRCRAEAEVADLIREVFGNRFRLSAAEHQWLEWKNQTVIRMAQGMYQKHSFADMPALGSALQEAGCSDEDILTHCRHLTGHVHGCWVVDLLCGNV